MNCPVCKEPMIVLELHKIEIDNCVSCGGIWLDGGELELLLEGAGQKNATLNSLKIDSETKEKKRPCPICLKKMAKVVFASGSGGEKKVLIDKCRANDGIWFDKGELSQTIEMESSDIDNKILAMLKDIFGQKQ